MDFIDDRHNDGSMLDSDNECDHKRLILKKNLSWTNSNSVKRNSLASLKTSRSNPHVIDDVRSLASSRLKIATSQFIPNRFQSQSNPSDDVVFNKAAAVAPLAMASTLTAATTHQTIATPSVIQFNIQPNSDFQSYSREILRHCKVNSQLPQNCYLFIS